MSPHPTNTPKKGVAKPPHTHHLILFLQGLQELEEAAHGPQQGGNRSTTCPPSDTWGCPLPSALILGTHTGHCPPSPQDLAEVCKRDGAERDEKDVDRVVGLGSSR